MEVIGFAGQMANGKDVAADYLLEKLNGKWERSAFANAVKSVFETAFGVDREFIEAWKRNADSPPSFLKPIRQSLQFIGDGFRQIKDEIWIDIALRDESRKLILSDSRYINEAKSIKAKGGITILVYRPGFLNQDPNPSESQIKPLIEFCVNSLEEGPIPPYEELLDRYGSEFLPKAMRYYDYYLENWGSLEDLYDNLDKNLIPFINEKFPKSKSKERFLF